MAKNDTTINDDDKLDSKYPVEEEKFKQSEPEKIKKYPAKTKKFFLVHKRNTKKELHINRETYTFWGHESLEVPESVIKNPDFENQRKYFLIKEV